MDAPTPHRIPTLTDIEDLLTFVGELPKDAKIITFPVNSIMINYGMGMWNLVSFNVFPKPFGYKFKFNLFGIDSFTASKHKIIPYQNLSVIEKRSIYNFLLNKYGKQAYYKC